MLHLISAVDNKCLIMFLHILLPVYESRADLIYTVVLHN